MRLAPASSSGVLLLVLAALAGPGAPTAGATDIPVPLNDCVRTDNGDPVVTALDISPPSVDLRQGTRSVTVRVSAVDTGGPGAATGIRSVYVSLSRDGIGSGGVSEPAAQIAPGTWQAQFRMAPGTMMRGTLRPLVSFQDGSGGPGSYLTGDQLAAQGFTATATVQHAGPRDLSPPRMTTFQLATRTVDSWGGDRRVKVRAGWRDDRSGVGRVLVQTEVGRVWLHRVTGTARDGAWRGSITVGQWVGDRTAHLYVKAFDRAGTRRIYGQNALRAGGFPSTFSVRARSDLHAPRLTSETGLPSAVDMHDGDVSLPVRLHLRDARSGVATVSAYLTTRGGSQRGGPTTRLHLASGTSHDGWWEGAVLLTHCQAFSDHWMLGARATDVRGGVRQPVFGDHVMEVQGTDHTVDLPIVGSAVSWPDPARFRVTFSEDVVGISATSATLRRTDFTPTYQTVPVEGTWACADAGGAAVDCVAGPVRTATVTLAGPHQPTSVYQAVLNPEHVLDVRDLAGNPPRRLEVYLGQEAPVG
jgi:hypothetical protein